MIDPTKKKLTLIFMLVIVVLNMVIFSISYVVLHQSINKSVRTHMSEDVQGEFLYQYTRSGLTPFKKMWDEHRFQILNKDGEIVISTQNSTDFYPALNRKLLSDAFAGRQGFEKVDVMSTYYLVSYFKLDKSYVGRVAASLAEAAKYERAFLKLIIMTFPGIVLLSFVVSSFLVNHAMKPISAIFTFQETFSSNVSHELRSPLASLKGNFEVSLRKERTADEYREIINAGLGEIDRIINLLNNLSMLASSKFKPLELFRKKADIALLLRDLIAIYKPMMHSKEIKLTVSEIPALTCTCDEGLIRRTLENLLDNALKYTPHKGTVDVLIARKAGQALVSISNSCETIGSDETEHFFEPFSRSRNSRLLNPEGKGLGLYIARYILRSHGGDLKVVSPSGNAFSVLLSVPEK